MNYRRTTKLSLDDTYKGINLYLKKGVASTDPKPPDPLVDLGFFIGIKHSSEDLFLQAGDRISGNRIFLYAGIAKSGSANNAAKHGFVYLCEDSLLSQFENGQGTDILIDIIRIMDNIST